VEDAAIKITVNNQFDITTQKTILFGKPVVIKLLQSLKMVFNILIILLFLRLAALAKRRCVGHDGVSFKSESKNAQRDIL